MSLIAIAMLASQVANPTTIQATITVDRSKPLAAIQRDSIGVGVAVWDEHMLDAPIPKMVRDAGFEVIRYPGGSYADIYQWKTHRPTKGVDGNVQPGRDFDSFMKMAIEAKTTPLITVNYGSNPEGTGGAEPSYAAEWVRYANRTKKYGVKYWEIGNEVYGNGFYNGQGWEYDLHAPDSKKPADRLKNPKLGPVEYGTNMNLFVRAMKAEDPTIKVGAILCTPGGWPDAVEPDWNSNVLKLCGKNIDFVVIHWYGEGKTPADVLNSLSQVPILLGKLKKTIQTYCGDNAKNIQIWMTEGDSSGIVMRHPSALFAADHFATWLSNGASHVDWWNLHNGLHVDRNGLFDDQGILSSGHSERGITQPPANTPFPAYFGVEAFSKFAHPGDTFLTAKSDQPNLIAHASLAKNGSISLLLINRDPDHTYEITTEGLPRGMAVKWSFGPLDKELKKSEVTIGSKISLPGYSLMVLSFRRP
jgi:hypothetical protein